MPARRTLALVSPSLGAAFLAALLGRERPGRRRVQGAARVPSRRRPLGRRPGGRDRLRARLPGRGVRRRRHRRPGGDGRRRRLVPGRDGQPGRPRRDDAPQRRLPRRPRPSQGRDVELPAVPRLHPDLGWRRTGPDRVQGLDQAVAGAVQRRRQRADSRRGEDRARVVPGSAQLLGSSSRDRVPPGGLAVGAAAWCGAGAAQRCRPARHRPRHGHGRRGHPCRGAGAGRLREGRR